LAGSYIAKAKIGIGQLGPKFCQDSPKTKIKDKKVEATVIGR